MFATRTKGLFIVSLAFAVIYLMSAFLITPKVNALNGSDFNADRIIDDAIFFNPQGMTSQEIQEFLNAKVPVCDTNGAQMYSSSQTRATYGTSVGYPPPYTCLKDFVQSVPSIAPDAYCSGGITAGNKSAATIVKEVAVACNVSPQVILVTLQKEQSFITDDWPWSVQYTKATGFGCPDTPLGTDVDANQNGCYDEFEGFYKQVYYGARQFQRYIKQTNIFNYAIGRNSFVAYQANNSACGGTNITPLTQATAALYNYTPYQPNAAALNNLYGTGDACSAYGNRNFWRMYNDWFGPTTNSENYWNLVKHPTDGRYFIATNYAVHYVPSQEVMDDWGIGSMQPITVPSGFITSRTYGSPVNRLLRDKFGNIFLMDGGKRHYVRDAKYLSLWQQDINSAITVHGLSTYVTDGDWLGYCAQSLTTPSNVWLMNGNKRLAINDTGLQAAWGCNSTQISRLTDGFITSYTSTGTATRSAVSNTNKKSIPDQGQLWTSNDQQAVEYYIPSGQIPVNLDSRLEQLIGVRSLTIFAQNIATGQWFLIENGNRHYIVSGALANLWGFNGLTPLSNSLLNSLNGGPDLTAAARTITPDKYYVMDGEKKHYLPNQTAIDEWLKPGTSVEVFANNFLDRYSEGNQMNLAVGKNDSTGAYFLAQSGKRLAIWNMNLYDAWAAYSYVPVNSALLNYLDDIGGAPVVAKDGTNYYFLENGVRYPVPESLAVSWSLNQAVSILPQTLSRYTLSGTSMTPFIKVAGQTYSLLAQSKTLLPQHIANSIPNSQTVVLQRNYFPTTGTGSHILRSSTPGDYRLWDITPAGKVLMPTTAHALNVGYISRGISLTIMSPEAIDAIPTYSQTHSLLLQSPAGALKLVSFGEGLGLPNADAVNAYAAITGSVTPVSQEVFNIFPVSRSATRLIRDDSGRVFWIEGGKKRWILNGDLLSTTFNGIPQTYLHGTVMTLIPDGPTMN